MGIDIYGWVEAKLPFYEEGGWKPVIDLFWLYDVRDYDFFGCFFGVRNYARFRPLAPERGLPADISPEVKREVERFGGDAFGHTWITWDEIKQVDWDEQSLLVDKRIREYHRNEQGEFVLIRKALVLSDFDERVRHDGLIDDQEQEWDLGDVVYSRRYMKRKDVKTSAEDLFRFLEILAARLGDDHVRLVVWFS